MTLGQRAGAAATILGLTATAGCATLANGRHQEVRVVSSPPGAQVWMNGTSVGMTPRVVPMRRRGAVILRIEKPGYSATITTVGRRPSWWSLGNLIFLNPVAGQGMSSSGQWLAFVALYFGGSLAVDTLSGGNSVRPRVVEVVLTPQVPEGGAGSWPTRR
jgi:hypothetical protein